VADVATEAAAEEAVVGAAQLDRPDSTLRSRW
jgi:hypothetical protein